MPRTPLPEIIRKLRARYGPPKRMPASGPFELIVWENVAYLVDDERRAQVFRALKQRVGSTPQAVLRASKKLILELIAPGGLNASQRLSKLRAASETMIDIGLARMRTLLRENAAEAKKLLKRFPGIGDPGADKILLFCKSQPSLAPDSNAVRVLVRLGYGKEHKSYAQTYRTVTEAVRAELPRDYNWLVVAHQLLRRHGQETCKRSAPRCEECPLTADCAWYLARWGR